VLLKPFRQLRAGAPIEQPQLATAPHGAIKFSQHIAALIRRVDLLAAEPAIALADQPMHAAEYFAQPPAKLVQLLVADPRQRLLQRLAGYVAQQQVWRADRIAGSIVGAQLRDRQVNLATQQTQRLRRCGSLIGRAVHLHVQPIAAGHRQQVAIIGQCSRFA
jgi:hypothetical protein